MKVAQQAIRREAIQRRCQRLIDVLKEAVKDAEALQDEKLTDAQSAAVSDVELCIESALFLARKAMGRLNNA